MGSGSAWWWHGPCGGGTGSVWGEGGREGEMWARASTHSPHTRTYALCLAREGDRQGGCTHAKARADRTSFSLQGQHRHRSPIAFIQAHTYVASPPLLLHAFTNLSRPTRPSSSAARTEASAGPAILDLAAIRRWRLVASSCLWKGGREAGKE